MEETFLISGCVDGTYSSVLVVGRENCRKVLAAELWFGNYEEAQADEAVNDTLKAFDDVDDYGGDVFHEDYEQAWIDVRRVLSLPSRKPTP